MAGRRDVMELLDPERAAERGVEKIPHQGTFNANPLSAAAGVATLELLKSTDAIARAHAAAAQIRDGMNGVLAEAGVPWAAYGTHTGFHIFTNPRGVAGVGPRRFDPLAFGYEDLKVPRGAQAPVKLALAMRVNGVDIMPWPGGTVSAAHGADEVDRTLEAFRRSLRMLKDEGEIR